DHHGDVHDAAPVERPRHRQVRSRGSHPWWGTAPRAAPHRHLPDVQGRSDRRCPRHRGRPADVRGGPGANGGSRRVPGPPRGRHAAHHRIPHEPEGRPGPMIDAYKKLARNWLKKTGDTMIGGDLTLFRDPTLDLHAVDKRYVDQHSNTALPAVISGREYYPSWGATVSSILWLAVDVGRAIIAPMYLETTGSYSRLR